MKKTILFMAAILMYIISAAQDYTQQLQSAVAKFDKANSVNDYQQLANAFETLTQTQSKEWLLYYYAAFSNAKIGWLYQEDGEKIEPYADKAEELSKKALSLLDTAHQKKELSEVYVVLSMINRARVFINPQTYGRKYGPRANQYIHLAKKANPDNPRAIYLEGWEKYYTPKMWGGDKNKAKELLQAAKQKLDNSTTTDSQPHWGKREVEELLGKIK